MTKKTMTRKEKATCIVVVELVSVVLIFRAVSIRDWSAFGWSLSIATAIPLWLIAFTLPTTCGVTTKKDGHPCPNSTTGILFGCGNAKGHTWEKFFARFGWHRQTGTSQSPSKARPDLQMAGMPPSSSGGGEPIVVTIKESRRDHATYWCAVISTFSGVISAAFGAVGIF